jgi:hypothetical protein
MAQDLKVTIAMLTTLSRELGCTVAKGGVATLNAPLKFPVRKQVGNRGK